jgi:hypothetical protein
MRRIGKMKSFILLRVLSIISFYLNILVRLISYKYTSSSILLGLSRQSRLEQIYSTQVYDAGLTGVEGTQSGTELQL